MFVDSQFLDQQSKRLKGERGGSLFVFVGGHPYV
jgi:hypothetical protein